MGGGLPDEDVTAWLTPPEVAALLKVSTRTVQRLTASGELPAVYPTRFPRYSAREVESYQRRLEGRKRRRVA